MADFPVKSDFQDKPASLKKAIKENASLKKAIKEALAPYDRKFISNLVADVVSQAIDISLQQNNDLPKRFQFLKWAESHRPRIPQALLNLPVPENEEGFRPDIYKRTNTDIYKRTNTFTSFESRFREYKYLQSQRQHFEDLQCHIADQQISPLQVLFGFMGES